MGQVIECLDAVQPRKAAAEAADRTFVVQQLRCRLFEGEAGKDRWMLVETGRPVA